MSTEVTGVVEVYFHEWGYVCDDSWDKNDADVACRQLGYTSAKSTDTGILIETRKFPYLIDDVECAGDETRLIDCVHTSRHDCGTGEHVSIECQNLGKCCFMFLCMYIFITSILCATRSDDFDSSTFAPII